MQLWIRDFPFAVTISFKSGLPVWLFLKPFGQKKTNQSAKSFFADFGLFKSSRQIFFLCLNVTYKLEIYSKSTLTLDLQNCQVRLISIGRKFLHPYSVTEFISRGTENYFGNSVCFQCFSFWYFAENQSFSKS